MRSENEMAAYALEVEPTLLPFVSELLADLEELGGDAELITEIVASLALPPDARVLDLGCGKGAVSLEIAEVLGHEVLGIDLFAPFIDHCVERARAANLSGLCSFERCDILKLEVPDPFDLAIYAALGDVLGPLPKTLGVLRRFVKPGGFIIISDDYLKEGETASYEGFEQCVTREETVRLLESAGMSVEREIIESHEAMVEENATNNARIRSRAEELARKHPELREAFDAFARDQEQECAFIETHLVPAVWLLRRTSGEH